MARDRGRSLSKSELDARRMRYEFWSRFVPWIGAAIVVLASWLPMLEIGHWVRDLAGKTTNINAVVSVSIAINVAFALTLEVQRRRRRAQAREIENLRGRVSAYEQRELAARSVTPRASRRGGGQT